MFCALERGRLPDDLLRQPTDLPLVQQRAPVAHAQAIQNESAQLRGALTRKVSAHLRHMSPASQATMEAIWEAIREAIWEVIREARAGFGLCRGPL